MAKKKKQPLAQAAEAFEPYCLFCGAKVGEKSECNSDNDDPVSAIYYCPGCMRNYCNVCSYETKDSPPIPKCLRCESVLAKVT